MTEGVNIPLLRKAVEWAEAEAAKPPELCEWEQNWWVLTPEERQKRMSFAADEPGYYNATELRAYGKAPECGTCYCIAGFVAASAGEAAAGYENQWIASRVLGIHSEQADELFDGENTIEDVRRIAEEIAGERL